MGKSWRQDARNDRWRREKQRRQDKSNYGHKYQKRNGNQPKPDQYSPFDDPPEYHESFA